jgi:hypothetical protein
MQRTHLDSDTVCSWIRFTRQVWSDRGDVPTSFPDACACWNALVSSRRLSFRGTAHRSRGTERPLPQELSANAALRSVPSMLDDSLAGRHLSRYPSVLRDSGIELPFRGLPPMATAFVPLSAVSAPQVLLFGFGAVPPLVILGDLASLPQQPHTRRETCWEAAVWAV